MREGGSELREGVSSLTAFPQDVKVVTTKSLHRILPHIEQRFYKVSQAEKAGEVYVQCLVHKE